MTKKKKESQKQLKEMYGNLAKFASQFNNPDQSPAYKRKTKGKNGMQQRSTVNVVSIRKSLKPLDKNN